MAYVKAQPFKPQFEDVNGNPLSLGTVEFFLWNTSTPTPYYTDTIGTSGGTSLTLNSLGKPANDLFFDTTITYKIVTKDAAGSVIDTLGPFAVSASAPDLADTTNVALGDAMVGVKRTLASAIATTLHSWIEGQIVDPKIDFGAVGDGTTDDTTAINNALASGLIIDGKNRTYAVTGNITMPADLDMRNATFKQLAPDGAGNVRTLTSASVNNLKLRNVKVLRNGDGTNGQLALDAGIWIEAGSGHLFEDIEVSGDDIGTGIVFNGCSNFVVRSPYVHDIDYSLGSDPGDDRVQGIWFTGCSDFSVYQPRAKTLGGNFGSGATTRYSRGIVFSGNSRFDVYGAYAGDVDQGIDCTGSLGNTSFTFHGGLAYQCHSFGWKASSSDSDGRWLGTIADKCGYAGHVISGASEAGTPNIENLTFIGCLSKSIGYNGLWTANLPAGFLILQGSFSLTYPRGVRLIACEAIDDQGSPTMYNGYRNQIAVAGDFNEAVHCTSRGHTNAAFDGFNAPHTRLSRGAVQAIPTATWTAIAWTVEDADYASMHSTPANEELVTIQRHGLYSLKAQVSFTANATGSRRLRFIVNGAGITPTEFSNYNPTAGAPGAAFGSVDLYLKATDVVRLEVYQDSGGNLDARTAESFFAVTEVGAYGATG